MRIFLIEKLYFDITVHELDSFDIHFIQ